jgi:methyltransferase (TIGR00027 family)
MKSRIEHKISQTAKIMCMFRAISFYEKESCLKSNDYIAPQRMPKLIKLLLNFNMTRNALKRMSPPGAYEYVVARTKYIDNIVEESLINGFNQIVIFGAGFDSRSIRFHRINQKAIFFELDALITQNAKINGQQKRGIDIPENTVYIPVDFNKENFVEKLEQNQFKRNEKTLFILEGIVMYLDEDAAIHTLTTLKSISPSHSIVLFDFIYKSVLRRENIFYGEKEIYEGVNKHNEAWRFGIEGTEISSFIEKLRLKTLKINNAKNLEQVYNFGNHRINETHCIALVEVP